MDDNKKKLYDALSQDYDLGSFEQFSSDIADEGKRRKLYDATAEEYDYGDFDSFSEQLGFGANAQQPAAQPAQPQGRKEKKQATDPNWQPPKPDYQPVEDFSMQNNQSQYLDTANLRQPQQAEPMPQPSVQTEKTTAERNLDSINQRLAEDNFPEVKDDKGNTYKMKAAAGVDPDGTIHLVATDKDGKDVELTGSNYADFMPDNSVEGRNRKQMVEDRETVDRIDKEIQALKDKDFHGSREQRKKLEAEKQRALYRLDNNPEYKRMIAEDRNKVAQRKSELDEALQQSGSGTLGADNPATAAVNPLAQLNDRDKLHNQQVYDAADRMLRDADEILATGLKYGEDNKGEFVKGAGRTMADPDFWTFGMEDTIANFTFRDVMERAVAQAEAEKKGESIDNPLSPIEEKLVEAYLTRAQAMMLRADDQSRGSKIGAGAAESLKFMVDMAITGAIGKAMTKGAAEAFSKKYMAKIGTTLANMEGKGAAALGKAVAGEGKWLGVKLAGDLIETVPKVAVSPLTAQAISQQAAQYDPETGFQSWGKSIGKGLLDAGIEKFSELHGGIYERAAKNMFKLSGAPALYKKIVSEDLRKTFSNIAKSTKTGKVADFFAKGGWDGMWEMAEEMEGAAAHELLMGEKGAWEDYWKRENWLEMAGSFAPMTIFGMGVNATQNIYTNRKLDKSIEKLGAFGFDTDALRERAENSTIADLAAYVSEGIGEEQKQRIAESGEGNGTVPADVRREMAKAAIDYVESAARKQALDGALEGEEAAKAEAKLDELKENMSGKRFWKSDNTVEIMQMPDGENVYVLSEPGSDGMVSVLHMDGTPGFAVIAEGQPRQIMTMDEYLSGRVEADRMQDEAARMETERQAQVSGIASQYQQGQEVQYQRGDKKTKGQVLDANDPDTLIVQTSDGTIDYIPWEEVAAWTGQSVGTLSDQEQGEAGAAALEAQDDAKAEMATAIEAGIEPGATVTGEDGQDYVVKGVVSSSINLETGTAKFFVEKAGGPGIVVYQMDLPYADFVQNGLRKGEEAARAEADRLAAEQKAAEEEKKAAEKAEKERQEAENPDLDKLLDENPEEFARINDEQYQDGGADTREILTAKENELTAQIEELGRQRAASTKPSERRALADQANRLREKITRIRTVLDSYNTEEAVEEPAPAPAPAPQAQSGHEAELEAQRQRAQEQADADFPQIQEKWNAAPKMVGFRHTKNLPNGKRLRGHYVLTEADAMTPSHDPQNGYKPSIGFPKVKGSTVNDRDYEHDKSARQHTEYIAGRYNGTALDNIPTVTPDGVVIDGNGRTMASQIAARNGSDADYLETLREESQRFGFSEDQVAQFQHPRVVFVTDESVPYTVDTFAQFNDSGMKEQTMEGEAVKDGKILAKEENAEIVNTVTGLIGQFDTVDQALRDEDTVKQIYDLFKKAGVFKDSDFNRMFLNDKMTDTGKERIKNALLGIVFDEDVIRLLLSGDMDSVKKKLIRSMAALVKMRGFQDRDYDLTGSVSEAVRLINAAMQDRNPKSKDIIGDYMQRMEFVTDEEGNMSQQAPQYSERAQRLAHMILYNGEKKVKDAFSAYLSNVENAAAGEISMFGENLSAEDSIKNAIFEQTGEDYGITDNTQEQGAPAESGEGAAGTEPSRPGDRVSGSENGSGRGGAESAPAAGPELVEQKTPESGYSVLDDEIAALEKEIADKIRGQLNAGLDPSLLPLVGRLAIAYIERGAYKIADFAAKMVAKFGDAIRTYIAPAYAYARQAFRIEGKRDVVDQMDNADTIDNFDHENFDKTPSAPAESKPTPTLDSIFAETTGQQEAEAVAGQIEEARQEVDTNPTDAQKEAGNYRKGHVTIDGYDISIENPKGSIRRGTDANGNEWQVEMNNDYGYIRMTEGPDGDHIDVFLSDNPTEGNVFVVDQVRPKTVKTISSDDLRRIYRDMQAKKYVGIGSKRLRELLLEANPDLYGEDQNATEKLIDAAESEKGNAFADAILAAVNEKENGVEFDEHKVMYGFPDEQSAREAYLSNYSPGWKGLGNITEVSKEEFKKWIESSHRKTKPFAEYKSVTPVEEQPSEDFGGLFAQPIDNQQNNSKNSRISEKESVTSQKEAQTAFRDTVRDALIRAVQTGEKPYVGITQLRKAASNAGMEVDERGGTDSLIQELVENAIVRAAKIVNGEAVVEGKSARERYDSIVKLYEMQPSINQRSSSRIAKQQYSTPIPMGFLADLFGWKMGKTVLEPTAGNGMMVFAIPGKFVTANEIDATRLDNLRGMNFAEVTDQDATEAFPAGRKYDVIIANPPFGSSGQEKSFDGKTFTKLEHIIALNALDAMAEDGRAAIIVGGNMEYNPNGSIKTDAKFWHFLYDHYNVKGVVDMDGSLYSRQGTTYPTRMILIDGKRSGWDRMKNTVFAPVKGNAPRKAETFDDLYDIVDEINKSNAKTNGYTNVRSEGEVQLPDNSNASGSADLFGSAGESRPAGDNVGAGAERGAGRGGSTRTEGSNEPAGTQQENGSGIERPVRSGVAADVAEAQPGPDNGQDTSGEGDLFGADREGEPGGNAGGPVSAEVLGTDAGVGSQRTQRVEEKRELESDKLHYVQHSGAFSLDSMAPAAMVEAMDNSLKRIEEEYGPIDEFVRKELGYKTKDDLYNALAAEQVDSVAMAIYQMKNGQAMIIGDQTGVGKGRQMAALIRWARKQGKKPIFVTQKSGLFSDLYRDLADTGSADLVPFIFNADGDMTYEDKDGNMQTAYKHASDSLLKQAYDKGELPEGCDYAILSYSQVSSGDAQSRAESKKKASAGGKKKAAPRPTPKADFLRKIAKDNFILMDESHTAAGESNTGAYFQSLIKDAAGATFASATFAKRPDTMPLYALRTSMSQANVSSEELIASIKKGGVALQEIMSRALTQTGQMVRRERDMSDVVTDWISIEDPDTIQRAKDNYDRTIEAFNRIINFQENFVRPTIEGIAGALAMTGGNATKQRGTDKLGIDNTPFASKTYNYTKQLMLALKAEAVVAKVIDEIQAGRHPVIALESTMESGLKEEGYSAGDKITDVTFATSLLRGLTTVMKYSIKDSEGILKASVLTPEELGPAGEAEYYNLQEFIRESTAGVFASPLDLITMRLQDAGYKVGELTGRDLVVQRSGDGEYIIAKRDSSNKAKKKTAADFNSGKLDVLILNKAASTGISLHASKKFKDQRQRTMILAQPMSDINDYMQMIGRIDRTGQVHRGYYINLALPVAAEQRFNMMLSTKLKSLNANTAADQEGGGSVEAVDLLNKYGDQVVVEYLRDHTDIYEKLGDGALKTASTGGKYVEPSELDDYQPREDDARRITGRVALLSTQEQEEFYDDVIQRYNDLIQYLNDTGTNDLKITTVPLRAKTLSQKVSSKGVNPEGDNPFAKDAYVETVEMDNLRKPMKADEVRATIEKLNGGLDEGPRRLRQLRDLVTEDQSRKTDAENERYQKALAKLREDIAKFTDKVMARKGQSEEDKQKDIRSYVEDQTEKVEQKHNDNLTKIGGQAAGFRRKLEMFSVGATYLVPDQLDNQMFVNSSPAIFCGFKVNEKKLTPSTTFAVFAVLDGRRKVEVKLSQPGPLETIRNHSQDNWGRTRETSLENWDESYVNAARKKGFIMTGNILQAIADTQDEFGNFPGQLVSYTDIDGGIHDGILMPDNWKPSQLKNSGLPVNTKIQEVLNGGDVTSTDGKVTIESFPYGNKRIELYVPKSKKEGGKYFENQELIALTRWESGFNTFRGKMAASIYGEENIRKALDILSSLGVRVADESAEEQQAEQQQTQNRYRFRDDATGEDLRFRVREEEPPTRTGIGYKVFVLKDGKLYPPMVANPNGASTPTGLWLDADAAPVVGTTVTGRQQVKAGGKGTQGGSGTLSYRPGWHLGEIPYAIQFNRIDENGEKTLFPKNFVWAEVEYAADLDYQQEAMSYGMKESGKFQHSLAGLPYLPKDGFYTYRTNPNPETDPWIITGAMRVKRLLTPTEVDAMVAAAGRQPQRRQAGAVTDEQIEKLNVEIERQLTVDPEQMKNYIDDLSANLGVKVRVIDDIEKIANEDERTQRRMRRSKGWYDTKTGEIVLVLPNAVSVADAEATVFHEGVGHEGLRGLFGDSFDKWLDEVYETADAGVRERIDAIKQGNTLEDQREATEEYMAEMAERGVEDNLEVSFWDRVKARFRELARAIGIRFNFTDADIRYNLWKSKRRLARQGESVMERADRVATDQQLRRAAEISYALAGDNDGPDGGSGGNRPLDGDRLAYIPTVPYVDQAEYQSRFDAANSTLDKKGVVYEYVHAMDPQHDTVDILSRNEIRARFKNIGFSDDEIDVIIDRHDTDSAIGCYVEGYGIVFFVDNIKNMEDVRNYYVHERQHPITVNRGYADMILDRYSDNLYVLEGELAKLTGADVARGYANNKDATARKLASEIISFAMSRVYKSPGFVNELKNLQIAEEIIDIINTIAYEESQSTYRPAIQGGSYGRTDNTRRNEGDNQAPQTESGRVPEETSRGTTGRGTGSSEIKKGREIDFGVRTNLSRSDRVLRDRAITNDTQDVALRMYGNDVMLGRNVVRELLVDQFTAVRTAMRAIEQESGKEANAKEDITKALNQLSSKQQAASERYANNFLVPLMDSVAKVAEEMDVEFEDIIKYVSLRRALEANELYAKRDAKEYYQRKHDDAVLGVESRTDIDRAAKDQLIQQLDADLQNQINDTERGLSDKYRELRGTDGKHEGKDYGATVSWFSEYVDANGNRTDTVPAREPGEDNMSYQRRLKGMRKPVAGADTLAGAEDLASQYIHDFETRSGGLTRELWDKINAATGEILRIQYDSHLITKEQYDDIRNRSQYYVPLRGFADMTAEDAFSYVTDDLSDTFVPALMRAGGRISRPDSPFGFIAGMAASTINEAYKNMAVQALYRFIANRKDNSLAVISDSWYTPTGRMVTMADVTAGEARMEDLGKEIWEPAYPNLDPDSNVDAQRADMDAFNADMEQKALLGQAVRGTAGLNLRNSFVFNRKGNEKQHFVRVKVLGDEKFIIFRGNPRAAQAINGILNPDTRQVSAYSTAVRAVARTMAKLCTSYSIPFWFSNFFRDGQTAIVNCFEKEGADYTRKMISNLPFAIGVVSAHIKGGDVHIKDAWSDAKKRRVQRLYDEYQKYAAGGAITGYSVIFNHAEYDKQFKRAIREKKSDLAETWSKIGDVLESIGRVSEGIEQVFRFATFITSREAGRPMEQCIDDAKNVTVNFNRKGSYSAMEWKDTANISTLDRKSGTYSTLGEKGGVAATAERAFIWFLSQIAPWVRTRFMFVNPNIQGTYTTYSNWKVSAVRTASAIFGVAMTSFLVHLASELFAPSPDDPDRKRKLRYSHLTDYQRRSNIILPELGGVRVSIPLSQEYAPFWAIGDIMATAALKEKYDQKTAWEIAKAIGEIMPVNVFEPTNIVPDPLAPALEAATNTNYQGRNIFQKLYNENTPDYKRAFNGTWAPLVDLSVTLNKALGGTNDLIPEGYGKLGNVPFRWNNPAAWQHIIEGMGGTTVSALGDVMELAGQLAGPEDVKLGSIPIINRFVKDPYEWGNDWYLNTEAKKFKTLAADMTKRAKTLEKSGDMANLQRLYESDNWAITDLYNTQYKKEISRLENEIRDYKNSPDAGDKQYLSELQQELETLQEALIKDVKNLLKERK